MQFGPQIPRLAPCARVKGKPTGKESHFIINTKSQADFRGGSGRRGGVGRVERRKGRGEGPRLKHNTECLDCFLLIAYLLYKTNRFHVTEDVLII